MPYVLRVVAGILFFGGVGFFVYTYIYNKPAKPFTMTSGKPQLSEQVVSRVEGYEQRITDGGQLKMIVRASVDITYSDNHHELENVEIENYSAGQKPDKIKANRAIYMPDQQKLDQGDVYFMGNVNVETKDNLFIKTESLNYNQQTQVIKSDVHLSFTRENISGQFTGGIVHVNEKRLEMNKDVYIQVNPEKPTELPLIVRAGHGTFSENERTLNFTGGATAEQGQDYMSGDKLSALMNEKKKVQKVDTQGNAYLRTTKENGAAEIRANAISFFFDANQQLEKVVANQNVVVRSVNTQSETELTGANKLDALFEAQKDKSAIKQVTTEGRTTVTMKAPQSRLNDPRAANKKLTADSVKLNWRTKGKDLEKAEAVGNAELIIEPLQATQKNDKKTLKAARVDCEFYETDNLAKTFVATGNTTTIIEPMQPSQARQTRTITSDKVSAVFARETQDAEQLEAQGNVKFNEQDKNGTAANATYTASDETIRLRDGEPTVWDSRARVKANEIDWNTSNETAYAKGKVATTYYSQEKTNGATPFEKQNSPVYVTSDRAEYNQATNIGVYNGNARAWQDDSFVRGDRLTLRGDNKVMIADGKVQSAIYNAKKKDKNGTSIVPVFAMSERMTYSDGERLIHYESNVDIRQGTDRINCVVADVYLQKDKNEVDRTIAQQNVVITSPNRRGIGDWAQYTLVDETFVLKGNPAKVEDQENGSNEGAVITIYSRENKVVAQGSDGKQNGGRVRTTHTIKKP